MAPADQDLGPLEMRALGLLDEREGQSVHDLRAALARAGHDLAYTTVMTVLARLFEKGLVVRDKDGRRYLYRAARRAPGVTRGIVKRIQRALYPGDRASPILALLDDEALTEDELRELRRKIDARLRSKP